MCQFKLSSPENRQAGTLNELLSARRSEALRKEIEKPADERRDAATVVNETMEGWLFRVRLVFRWCWSGLYDFLYFFSRSFSRFESPATNSPDGIPGTMADLPRNIPSAMTDFSGHVAGRVTDCSASFFNLRAAIHETTGKNKYKNNGGGLEILVSLHADSIPHPGLTRGPRFHTLASDIVFAVHGKARIFGVLRYLFPLLLCAVRAGFRRSLEPLAGKNQHDEKCARERKADMNIYGLPYCFPTV